MENLIMATTASGDFYKDARLNQNLNFKRRVAEHQVDEFKRQITYPGQNYDDRVYFDGKNSWYPYMFGKTLTHDSSLGFVKKDDVDKIIKAVRTGTKADLNAIPKDSTSNRKLEGVLGSLSTVARGSDPSVSKIHLDIPAVDSEGGAFEMAEVYAMALLRDVPFSEYDSDDDANAIIDALDNFPDKTSAPLILGKITAGSVFRGRGQDELIGPYISQFLLKPFHYGNIPINQLYEEESDVPASVTEQGWLNIQNGKTIDEPTKTGRYRYCYNGRILGSMVHNDPMYYFYWNAALIAFQQGIEPSGFKDNTANTTEWTDSGRPDVLSAVADVALGALRTAWNLKYNTTMRIRPEVYAQRVNFANDEQTKHIVSNVPGLRDLNENILNGASSPDESPILSRVAMDNLKVTKTNDEDGIKSLYLKLQYPEGSPTHPATPAGHAVVAGACCTVLKAMLKTHDDDGSLTKWVKVIESDVTRTAQEATPCGCHLSESNAPDIADMTIVGELNKLASNVALGRDFAGVHYRIDGDGGILAGEQYAISFLEDRVKELWPGKNGLFQEWRLSKFDGTEVIITPDGVTDEGNVVTYKGTEVTITPDADSHQDKKAKHGYHHEKRGQKRGHK